MNTMFDNVSLSVKLVLFAWAQPILIQAVSADNFRKMR